MILLRLVLYSLHLCRILVKPLHFRDVINDAYTTIHLGSSYTPNSFRRSIAVHILEAGESLVAIKAFLGHSTIVATTVYAKVTPELANKYLDERGKPLENIDVQSVPQSIPEAMPFLYG